MNKDNDGLGTIKVARSSTKGETKIRHYGSHEETTACPKRTMHACMEIEPLHTQDTSRVVLLPCLAAPLCVT
jgi:hypothetical protein